MRKIIFALILFLIVSSMAFSQFYTEPPVIEFDVDFGSDSFGVLRYYGYRPSEVDFWLEVFTGGIFYFLMDPFETLMPPSYRQMENNTALDDFIKSTMRRNNINVCFTFYPNYFGGFTYIINYSFDNYATFGFITIDSTYYISSSVRPSASSTPPVTSSRYSIITGRAYSSSITQDELRKRINLQGYDDIVSWLRWGSHNVVESTGVQFDRLINVLVNNFRNDRSTAENSVSNMGNNIRYHWLVDSNGRVTEWIVYFRER